MALLELRALLEESSGTWLFSPEVCADGVAIEDFKDYAIDLASLLESAHTPGDYFIITCTCSDAGCAGIWKPIRVEFNENEVSWHVVEPPPERMFDCEKTET